MQTLESPKFIEKTGEHVRIKKAQYPKNGTVLSGIGPCVDPESTYVNPGSTYVDLEFQIHSVDPGFTYVDHGSHA